MARLKEIVTKAVITKYKKSSKEELIIDTDSNIDTVLGCWVINHNFMGQGSNGRVIVEGSFDINVWYAYDNNTKTNVLVRNFPYQEAVKLKPDLIFDNTNEIIVRSLKNPNVADVVIDGNKVILTTEKELGIEIVGDAKFRVNVEAEIDDYEEEVTVEEIDINITEDYLNGVNQN